MSERETERDAVRRGFWLRMAREEANLSQPGAAKALGLSDRSASTISAWEAGTREPSPSKLKAMARLYSVPLSLFYDPPQTAHEDVRRVKELALAAIAAEQEDWEAGDRDVPPAEGGGAERPRRRSA